MTLRWDRIWIIGSAMGLLIPDFRLPEWLNRVFPGCFCGSLAGVLSIAVLDTLMAGDAVKRAYPPVANTELRHGDMRPLPGQKDYPSTYRRNFARSLIGGATLGTLCGIAVSLSGRKKAAGLILVSLVMTVLVADTWSAMANDFEDYVRWHQDATRHSQPRLQAGIVSRDFKPA